MSKKPKQPAEIQPTTTLRVTNCSTFHQAPHLLLNPANSPPKPHHAPTAPPPSSAPQSAPSPPPLPPYTPSNPSNLSNPPPPPPLPAHAELAEAAVSSARPRGCADGEWRRDAGGRRHGRGPTRCSRRLCGGRGEMGREDTVEYRKGRGRAEVRGVGADYSVGGTD